MVPFTVALITLCWLPGCGRDPILERAEAEAAARTASGAAKPAGGTGDEAPARAPGDASGGAPGGAAVAHAAGIPEEPAPGIPDGGQGPSPEGPRTADGRGIPEEPAPGAPGSPGGGDGTPGGGTGAPPSSGGAGSAGAGAARGPTVTIGGAVRFEGWTKGSVRVTAFDGDHAVTTGKRPSVVGFAVIDRPGSFSLSVPEGAGKVYVEAAVDEDGDGRPSPVEPQGRADRFPVTVGSAAVEGLTVVLQRRAPPPGGARDDY